MKFRVHFSDGDAIEVTAETPTAARDEARKRKGDGQITKVKKVRR